MYCYSCSYAITDTFSVTSSIVHSNCEAIIYSNCITDAITNDNTE